MYLTLVYSDGLLVHDGLVIFKLLLLQAVAMNDLEQAQIPGQGGAKAEYYYHLQF